MLSLGVLLCGLSIVLWRWLFSCSVHEVADEGSSVWIFLREVEQTVKTIICTPYNDCKLYDFILLPRKIELHCVNMFLPGRKLAGLGCRPTLSYLG